MLLFLDDRPDDKHEKKKLVTALKGRRGLVPPKVCGIENAVINRLILAFFFCNNSQLSGLRGLNGEHF